MKTVISGMLVTVFLSFTLLFAAGGHSMLLQTGQKAPDFSLVSSTGDTVRLSDFSQKNYLVLIFYPGDETPGCTKQLCAIRDDHSKFEAKNAKVFGVNPANGDSHRKFIKRYGFQFPLLIDEDQKTAKLYGCGSWPMVKRTVYVIDPQGTVIYVKKGLPPDEEILQSIPDKKE
jgi:thioredoxin-dependent peroxiredoxin